MAGFMATVLSIAKWASESVILAMRARAVHGGHDGCPGLVAVLGSTFRVDYWSQVFGFFPGRLFCTVVPSHRRC